MLAVRGRTQRLGHLGTREPEVEESSEREMDAGNETGEERDLVEEPSIGPSATPDTAALMAFSRSFKKVRRARTVSTDVRDRLRREKLKGQQSTILRPYYARRRGRGQRGAMPRSMSYPGYLYPDCAQRRLRRGCSPDRTRTSSARRPGEPLSSTRLKSPGATAADEGYFSISSRPDLLLPHQGQQHLSATAGENVSDDGDGVKARRKRSSSLIPWSAEQLKELDSPTRKELQLSRVQKIKLVELYRRRLKVVVIRENEEMEITQTIRFLPSGLSRL
jgi:hypothetical protein